MLTESEYETNFSQLQQLEGRTSPFHLVTEMLLMFVGCVAGWFFLGLWQLVPWFAATYTLLLADRWLLLRKSDALVRRRYRQHLSLSFLAVTISSTLPLFLWFQGKPSFQFAAMAFLACAILNTYLIRTMSLTLTLCYLIPNSTVLLVMAASFFWHPTTSPVEAGMIVLVAVFAVLYFTSSVFEALRQHRQHLATQQQLAMAQKIETVGTLSAGIAHDFNNLLGVISGNLELLNDEARTPAAKKLISSGLLATERAASISERLLQYGGEAPLQRKLVNPVSLLVEMSETWRQLLPARIEFLTQIDQELGLVIVDEDVFRAALDNLVLNANDAIEESGSISVTARLWDRQKPFNGFLRADTTTEDFIKISVIDTGHGIEPDQLEKIFDPYFSSKRVYEGVGLGLAGVLGFLKQSGGDISIHSSVGRRTVVDLLLPIAKKSELDISIRGQVLVRDDVSELDTSDGAARILIVEDEPQLLDVLTQKLLGEGYNVTTAETGDAAADYLRQNNRFDLVLTDVVMPGDIQGPDLVERFAAAFPGTKFIVMSGYTPSESWASEAARAHAVLLKKPTSLEGISNAVAKLLSDGNPPIETGST
jgi:signal transduction histidine kinase/ActR/RegA family two-component response regulator